MMKMTFLLPTVCLLRSCWHSVAPLWMKSVFLVRRLRAISLWCQMLSSSPHSVPQPRSSSSTSSSSSTARRRPTSASWLTGTGGTGRRGTVTAALKTRTGNRRLGAPVDVSSQRCCAAVLLTINVIVFLCCVFVCVCVSVSVWSESSNKENSDSPEWSFTVVRQKKTEGRKVLNGTVSIISLCIYDILYRCVHASW